MKKNLGMLALIMAFWFTISFITNILGPLIPDIIHNFNLSDLAMAGFIPTSFFIAYAIMSIPAGLMIDRFGEKPVLFLGFLMPFIGTTLFACMHTYPVLLASSFIIGLGMAMLQTVINPLQRVVGGEENYAFVAEVAQFVFGIHIPDSRTQSGYIHGRPEFLHRPFGRYHPARLAVGIALLGIYVTITGNADCRKRFPLPENRVERR